MEPHGLEHLPQSGIYQMDGLEGLHSLPQHSVDMILADPPYGTTRNSWDARFPLQELWEAVRWALKPNGAALFFAQCPYDKILGASNIAMLRYEWIWVKSKATGHLNANRCPLKKTENILVFYRKAPTYNPQWYYAEPYERKGSGIQNKRTNYNHFVYVDTNSPDGRRYPKNVLHFGIEQRPVHPTQKPVGLCEYLIKTYTNEGETVVDFCAGSGTTGVAAINTHRDYILFETNAEYCDIAAKRLGR